jgi:diguanylate cyclase (GGDEF)-like protein
MIKPPLALDETVRLQTLHALKILDTKKEDRFDRVTRLAARLFSVPIALISLVDRNRQWFKSCQGLQVSETPREISFCGHAILQDDVFIVENAMTDSRFRDNPLVTGEPRIRFYAGCPLRAPGGSRVGTLCIIDRVERDFSPEDSAMLRELADMVEEELFAMTLAATDELTKIPNRRGFRAIADHVLPICRRHGHPACLAVFDLNGFKKINDQFGHEAGDRVLTDFATILLKTFRDSDVVARLGGDEFCVLLAGAGDNGLEAGLQRLDKAIEDHNERAGERGRLAFSVGTVAFDPVRHATTDDLLREADNEMYADKHQRKGGAAGVARTG